MMIPDLNLLALRYALGELPAAEAADFEGRLANDQLAREALADSVLLMAAVRETAVRPSADQVLQPLTTRRSRLPALLSCAAAALAVVVLFDSPDGQTTAQRRESREATALVGMWSELGLDHPGLLDPESDLSDDDASPDVPDWMVAAVLDVMDVPPREEGTL